LADPASYADELAEFDDAAVQRIMGGNLRELLALS
jgi:hypothetical protein